MPDDMIHNGELVIEGTIIPDEYEAYFDSGAVSPGMVRGALAALDGDIVVRVNSAGGDPISGEAIRVMLAEHPGAVTVQIVGEACSAASLMVMGADRIEMSAGSVMMIHDPSTVTVGTEAQHRTKADMLGTIADTYAAVYAARCGKGTAEVREMMRGEMWMGPERAIAEGFADAVMGEASAIEMVAEAAFDAARHHHAEAVTMLVAAHTKFHPASKTAPKPAATGGLKMASQAAKEAHMSKQTDAAKAGGQTETGTVATETKPQDVRPGMQMNADAVRDEAMQAERKRQKDIRMAARPHIASGALDEAFVDGLIDEGITAEMASHKMLQRLGGAQDDVQMRAPAQARAARLDDRETRRTGLTMALTARITGEDPADERAHPYMEMALHEMAAVSMGRDRPGMGSYAAREDILMSAMHSTSDFTNILSTSVNRVLAAQYELVERTFTSISREMSFNDFRAHDVVRPDEYPTLKKVNETGEIKFGQLGDSKETVALGAYATGIGISRQALVNDDLGAIQDVIDNAAAIVPEFEEATFWAYFLSNPALSDGKAMFHADHGNLAGSGTAITVAAIAAGRQALRTMKAADGVRNVQMNAPAILLVGPAKETEAEQFIATNLLPTKAGDVNPFAGKLRPVVTEAITDNSWYLLVDPAKRTHNFKHGYLRDRRAPRVRVEEPFGVQGMRMTIEQDFGVGGVNYRGGYKNAGA